MNRIYQGRVSKVEIPPILSASNGERNEVRCRNQNADGQPLDIDVLWRHHELFQDAVIPFSASDGEKVAKPDEVNTKI